jgi:hypothetical protein
VISKVGWFDENFYPAYKEDQDYSYRCNLAGVERKSLPGASATHLGSQTIASDPEYAIHNLHTHSDWNRRYYITKWGGESSSEVFTTPYGRLDCDHRWWRDPSDSIHARDWDNGRRHAMLQERYESAVATSSDINEHLPRLREMSSGIDVVEFGVRCGLSTTAILAGRPRTLTSYDIEESPAVRELGLLATDAPFRFVRADVTVADIPWCDLLFEDSHHTANHVGSILARHSAKVRKWLVFHDTETFGERGEDGGPGIMFAIRPWLASHPEWTIACQSHVNNGLLVLERKA